jgi:hypothetical protein
MLMNGRAVQVAVGTQFMVEPNSRGSVGIRLLKKCFSGPQDLFIADEANDYSRQIWEGLGGATALLYSLRWTRILRPGRFVKSLLIKHRLLAPLELASNSFCLDDGSLK